MRDANDFINAKSHAREKPLLAVYFILHILIWIFYFATENLPGLSRNEPQILNLTQSKQN